MQVQSYLPEGMPIPVSEGDGLSAPFWKALKEDRVSVQRCKACGKHQFTPEWLCHRCLSFDLEWVDVAATGVVYSWTRVWHPTHPALKERGPYVVVVVELPHADGIRMVGNLLGDAQQEVLIGKAVKGSFEHHPTAQPSYTLLQWEYA
jgi:uncharacterized OB-fold protein